VVEFFSAVWETDAILSASCGHMGFVHPLVLEARKNNYGGLAQLCLIECAFFNIFSRLISTRGRLMAK